MNDLQKTINKFRLVNGVKEISFWDNVVSNFCKEHCWAMIKSGNLYHTEPFYLEDWKEAIAKCSYLGDWTYTIYYMIFEVLGRSEEHRKILLESSVFAGDAVVFKLETYLTIRAK